MNSWVFYSILQGNLNDNIMDINKNQAVELLIKAIPYPNQITDLDLMSSESAIYFNWRSTRYKFNFVNMRIDESKDGMLIGTDSAILMISLINKIYVEL